MLFKFKWILGVVLGFFCLFFGLSTPGLAKGPAVDRSGILTATQSATNGIFTLYMEDQLSSNGVGTLYAGNGKHPPSAQSECLLGWGGAKPLE